MALTEDIIFSDPVLQRILFDERRFAPQSDYAAGKIADLQFGISEAKVEFLKEKNLQRAERWQSIMRNRWFAIRKLCDGYFAELPAGHSDGCEHVIAFAHDYHSSEFRVDLRQRRALWFKYVQKAPPDPWRFRPGT